MNELEPAGEGPLIPPMKSYRESEVIALERLAHSLDGRAPTISAESSLIPQSVELTRRHAEAVERIAAGGVAVVALLRELLLLAAVPEVSDGG